MRHHPTKPESSVLKLTIRRRPKGASNACGRGRKSYTLEKLYGRFLAADLFGGESAGAGSSTPAPFWAQEPRSDGRRLSTTGRQPPPKANALTRVWFMYTSVCL